MPDARQTMLEQAAKILNESKTGCIAEVKPGVVVVQAPGIGYIDGKPGQRFYSTEHVYSVRAAHFLIASMK